MAQGSSGRSHLLDNYVVKPDAAGLRAATVLDSKENPNRLRPSRRCVLETRPILCCATERHRPLHVSLISKGRRPVRQCRAADLLQRQAPPRQPAALRHPHRAARLARRPPRCRLHDLAASRQSPHLDVVLHRFEALCLGPKRDLRQPVPRDLRTRGRAESPVCQDLCDASPLRIENLAGGAKDCLTASGCIAIPSPEPGPIRSEA